MMSLWLAPLSMYFLLASPGEAFVCPAAHRTSRIGGTVSILGGRADKDDEPSSWLLEFSTASGEVINPYEVLKLSRNAKRTQVREAYVQESKRYHPDAMMHKSILPGSCNNMDDVRDQWERIKLSYEILSEPKRRSKYDRHETLADPGKAATRAAVDAAVSGMAGIGKGLFGVGVFAVKNLAKSSKVQEAAER